MRVISFNNELKNIQILTKIKEKFYTTKLSKFISIWLNLKENL